MALTFPRTDVMTSVRFRAPFTFDLARTQEMSRQRSGAVRARDLTPAFWAMEATTRSLMIDDLTTFEAVLRSLDGSIQSFEAFDVRRPYPRAHPQGFAGTVTIFALNPNNRSLRLTSTVGGLKMSVGDYFAYDLNGVRRLHQVMEEPTLINNANGTTNLFEIRPAFPPGIATGVTLNINRPSAIMTLEPGSVRTELETQVSGVARFRAVEG